MADLHGQLPPSSMMPMGDILLLGGDLCPTSNHSPKFQAHWLDTTFRKWLETMPYQWIVGVAGNHDFVFQERPDLVPNLPWTYLQDRGCECDGIRVYGSPWQPIFYDWSFNLDEQGLKQKWALIPDNIQVLLLHGPPYGYGDLTARGERVGSQSLTDRIQQIRPALVVCGHIHPAYGMYMLEATTVLNAAFVNEQYIPTNPPLVFDL